MTLVDSPAATGCVTLGREALVALRAGLERAAPGEAAALLQQAGFESGRALHERLTAWCGTRFGSAMVSELDAELLSPMLGEFFALQGWGMLTLSELAPSVLALDAYEWAEAEPGSAAVPSCHFSSGMLADVLTRIAGAPVAVMEVECRSAGGDRCRFLAGAPETLQVVYERMVEGMDYVGAVGA